MRISDWSSDVCSSDLLDIGVRHHDDEFLAAVARHQVDVAHAPRYPLGQLDQHLVAALVAVAVVDALELVRSEEHTSELQSLMRISYAVFCLIKKKNA